jgi:hypothetical protein
MVPSCKTIAMVRLQRQLKALTRTRLWSRCERSLLSTPETKSRFNRYDQRCTQSSVSFHCMRADTDITLEAVLLIVNGRLAGVEER